MEEMCVSIPKNIENMMLPDPALLTYYKNLDSRTIWVDTEITDYSLEIGRNIMMFNADDAAANLKVEDRIPIKLMFFSPGGDIDVNNALIDIIKLSKTPIVGINVGIAYSAACFIYMSCHKRYALPSAGFLLHKGSITFSNLTLSFSEAAAEMIEFQRKVDDLFEYVVEHSTMDEKTVEQNLGSEWFITAQEAYEKCGFVDKIVESLDEVV